MVEENLRNDMVYRRFLTGDNSVVENHTGSLSTSVAPDGTVLLRGYGHNLYAEFREGDDRPIIYVGNREWAWDQYPPRKSGKPTTARHIDQLLDAADALGIDYIESARAPKAASVPNYAGDLSEVGRLGGFE